MSTMTHKETKGGKYSALSGGPSLKGKQSGINMKGSRLNEGGDTKFKGTRKGAGKKY